RGISTRLRRQGTIRGMAARDPVPPHHPPAPGTAGTRRAGDRPAVNAAVDTIVAGATAPGRGGIGIVRISGPETRRIATEILGSLPEARYATVSVFSGAGGLTIDVGIALYFPGPASFTGEDVLELHG